MSGKKLKISIKLAFSSLRCPLNTQIPSQSDNMANPDPLLLTLGITSRAPYDWGDEPQAKLDPISKTEAPTRSGLDSVKQYVQDRDVDDPVKCVMTSLLVKANIPLTTKNTTDDKASRKRYFDLLEGGGDVASRDVSIRGLSDRGCAGLTVECRTSLFGSILRVFEMTEDDKKNVAGGDTKAAPVKGGVKRQTGATIATPGYDAAAVKTEAVTDKVVEEVKDITASCSIVPESVPDTATSITIPVTGQTAPDSVPSATNVEASDAKVQATTKQTGKTVAVKIENTKADAPQTSFISPEVMEAAKKNPNIAHDVILSTAEIVRTCHLAARPGDIPPCMDSKEFTMAALHFLSSHVPMISENDDESTRDTSQSLQSWKVVKDTFPVLPLLYAINPEESLEKRVYGRMKPLVELGKMERKPYPDSMDANPDFRRKVINLERAFTSSLPFVSKTTKNSVEGPLAFQLHVPRRKLCTRIETEGVKEELTLLISGHIMQDSQSKQLQRSQSCDSVKSN